MQMAALSFDDVSDVPSRPKLVEVPAPGSVVPTFDLERVWAWLYRDVPVAERDMSQRGRAARLGWPDHKRVARLDDRGCRCIGDEPGRVCGFCADEIATKSLRMHPASVWGSEYSLWVEFYLTTGRRLGRELPGIEDAPVARSLFDAA